MRGGTAFILLFFELYSFHFLSARGVWSLSVRFWFSPAGEVPIYRQVVTQVVLAILSGDLRPGERLPSTRELARRFSIHPNTVSARA